MSAELQSQFARRLLSRRIFPLDFLFAISVAIAWSALSAAVDGQESSEGAREGGRYRVDRATTFVTEPRGSDGTVDFAAAVDREFKRRLNLRPNAAKELFALLEPAGFSGDDLTRVRAELELETAPARVAKFRPLAEFVRNREPVDQELDEIARVGWLPEGHPEIGAWLNANADVLDQARAASCLEGWYFPTILEAGNPYLALVPVPFETQCRDICYALIARAMRSVQQKDNTGAWEDLLAAHRIGRRIGTSPYAIMTLVGGAIVSRATNGLRVFLMDGANKSLDWQAKLKAWDAESAAIDYGFVIGWGERAAVLQSITLVADSTRTPTTAALADAFDRLSPMVTAAENEGRRIDWDESLRWANTFFDRAQANWDIRDPVERQEKFDELQRKLFDLGQRVNTPISFFADRPNAFEHGVAAVFLYYLAAGADQCRNLDARLRGNHQVIWLGLASLAYRQVHGRFPDRVEEILATAPPNVLVYPRHGTKIRFLRDDRALTISHSGLEPHWDDSQPGPRGPYPRDDWGMVLIELK